MIVDLGQHGPEVSWVLQPTLKVSLSISRPSLSGCCENRGVMGGTHCCEISSSIFGHDTPPPPAAVHAKLNNWSPKWGLGLPVYPNFIGQKAQEDVLDGLHIPEAAFLQLFWQGVMAR